MKFIKSIFKEIPIALNIGFLLSLLSVCLMKFWWDYIPEFWNGGYELGQIMENIFMSTIAGYIFYFIVDFLPKRKRKNDFKYLLSNQLERTYYPVNNFIETLKVVSYTSFSMPPTIEEIRTALSKIKSPNNSEDKEETFDSSVLYSWLKHYEQALNKVNDEISKLLSYEDLIEPELKKIIFEVLLDKSVNKAKLYLGLKSKGLAIQQFPSLILNNYLIIKKLEYYQMQYHPAKFNKAYYSLLVKSVKERVSAEEMDAYWNNFQYPKFVKEEFSP